MNMGNSAVISQRKRKIAILWQGTAFLFSWLFLNIIIYIVDQRTLNGEYLWVKPIKFQISFILHFITLAVLSRSLGDDKRESNTWKIWSYAVVTAGVFEVMYIFLQAARGRESHFNISTGIEAFMYGLMGFGAVILVASSFYLGLLLYKEHRKNPQNVIAFSSSLGLMIGSFLTLVIGGYLSTPLGSQLLTHHFDSAMKVPFLGWHLNGQDLRIPHFLATHMMQIFPIYGWWLSSKKPYASKAFKHIKRALYLYSIFIVSLFFISIV